MYHRTLKAHLHRDAVELARMQSEAEADAAVDAALGMIDPGVITDHLLEDGT